MAISPRVPDLDALDALVTVAHRGSMGAAAADLGLSQQAVSARVRRAERLLGLAVFARSPRGVQPTPAGRSVITWADDVLRAAAALDAGVADLRGDARAAATVAVSNTVSDWLFPQWAASLRRSNPNARITALPGNSVDVLEAVAQGRVDLGFVECPGIPRELDSVPVGADELVVVVPPGHPWARRGASVTPARIAATPLVVREPGSGTRATFEEGLREEGLSCVEPLLELGSTAAVRAAVSAAGAPAVLSSLAVRRDVEDGRLVVVPVEGRRWPRELRAVWTPARRPTRVAADLVALARAGRQDPAPG